MQLKKKESDSKVKKKTMEKLNPRRPFLEYYRASVS